jgi:hypothetical protein
VVGLPKKIFIESEGGGEYLQERLNNSVFIAPVGLAWDRALALQLILILHADDGNHTALAGAFLTSLVFYEVITGMSVDLLPYYR